MQFLYLAAALIAAAAAFTDHRSREIPNWLTFGGMGVGFLGNCVVGYSATGLEGLRWAAGLSLLGGLVNMLPPFMMYRLNPQAIGGGDVKLLAALGFILGPVLGIEAEFYGFIVAALYAPARMAYEGRLRASLRNIWVVFRNTFRARSKQLPLDEAGVMEVRFAPALLVGTLVCITAAAF